jgi:hypothetical protein
VFSCNLSKKTKYTSKNILEGNKPEARSQKIYMDDMMLFNRKTEKQDLSILKPVLKE